MLTWSDIVPVEDDVVRFRREMESAFAAQAGPGSA
jgi:hypothetical protein